MPPAKKPASRARAGASSARTATRKDVEKAIARFEKALDEASSALQALGQDAGTGAKRAYREIEKALRAMRRDATKTNKALLKDLEKLAAAVTPARASRSTATKRTPAKTPARRTTRSTTRAASSTRSARSSRSSAAKK